MIQRIFGPLLVIAVLLGVACIDMSAPKGAASISVLLLPSPSVIVADSMRDSLGIAAPLRLIAYDATGTPVSDAGTQFFVIDTLANAHLTAENVLVGDRVGVARVVGQIGNLQTPIMTVPVGYLPATIAAGPAPDTALFPLGIDSASSIGFSSMAVTVKSAKDSGSAGIIVRYKLISGPVTREGRSPAAFIADDAGAASLVDTTDAGGNASRRLTVNTLSLGDAGVLVAGSKVDSAVVEASASYRGALLSGSPVRIVVPIAVKPLPPS